MTTIFIAIAAWRIAHLLVHEDGPWDIVAKFRRLIGVRTDEYSQVYGKNQIAKLFTCVWCLSIWFGFIAAFWSDYETIPSYAINALAIAGIMVIVESFVE